MGVELGIAHFWRTPLFRPIALLPAYGSASIAKRTKRLSCKLLSSKRHAFGKSGALLICLDLDQDYDHIARCHFMAR